MILKTLFGDRQSPALPKILVRALSLIMYCSFKYCLSDTKLLRSNRHYSYIGLQLNIGQDRYSVHNSRATTLCGNAFSLLLHWLLLSLLGNREKVSFLASTVLLLVISVNKTYNRFTATGMTIQIIVHIHIVNFHLRKDVCAFCFECKEQ